MSLSDFFATFDPTEAYNRIALMHSDESLRDFSLELDTMSQCSWGLITIIWDIVQPSVACVLDCCEETDLMNYAATLTGELREVSEYALHPYIWEAPLLLP